MLRLVAETIAECRAQGKGVSVCGEMAGDVPFTRLLLGLGLRSFPCTRANPGRQAGNLARRRHAPAAWSQQVLAADDRLRRSRCQLMLHFVIATDSFFTGANAHFVLSPCWIRHHEVPSITQPWSKINAQLGRVSKIAVRRHDGLWAARQAAMAEGSVSAKHKAIALAISITQHCSGCVGFHVNLARKLGCTRAELEECWPCAST